MSTASSEEKAALDRGFARRVGELDADIRGAIANRVNSLWISATQEFRGEILADVSVRIASSEARTAALEAKLAGDLQHSCGDLAIRVGKLETGNFVSRIKILEEEVRRSALEITEYGGHMERIWSALEVTAGLGARAHVKDSAADERACKDHMAMLDSQTTPSESSVAERKPIAHVAPARTPTDDLESVLPQGAALHISCGLRDSMHGLMGALHKTMQSSSQRSGSSRDDVHGIAGSRQIPRAVGSGSPPPFIGRGVSNIPMQPRYLATVRRDLHLYHNNAKRRHRQMHPRMLRQAHLVTVDRLDRFAIPLGKPTQRCKELDQPPFLIGLQWAREPQ